MLTIKIAVSFFPLLFIYMLTYSATVTYEEDDTNFPNPERGFYLTSVSESGLQSARKEGITIVRKYYRIDAYSNTDVLPQTVLNTLNSDAAILRKNGAKIVPRFAYNCGGCNNPPLKRILLHIEQLTPLLRSNSDVIAFIEAGFIGMCGEWHFSDCDDANGINTTEGRKTVLYKLLDAVPGRMVAVRYNRHKRAIFGQVPLGPDSAFSGSYNARTGGHNDCFTYDASDRGSYQKPETTEWQKNYLNQDNRYVPQGGESCGASANSECEKAMAELKQLHWDVISNGFHPSVISKWKSGGCHGTVQKNLGYRIKMTNAHLPDAVRPGNSFTGTINLQNTGWGKIYNIRDCELVFRNTVTSKKFIVKLTNDPRHWCMTDSIVPVTVSALIPVSTPDGDYAVYLNLPDTASSIHNRPEYSIRLANKNVWEDSTGYNSLLHKVTISPTVSTRYLNLPGTATNFSLYASQKNQIFTISMQSPDLTPVTIEIFTPLGKRILSRQINCGENNRFVCTWKSPAKSCYIVKARQGEKLGKDITIF